MQPNKHDPNSWTDEILNQAFEWEYSKYQREVITKNPCNAKLFRILFVSVN